MFIPQGSLEYKKDRDGLGGKRGAGVRGTGSRGTGYGVRGTGSRGTGYGVWWKTRGLVENAGSGGKRGVWWKTRGPVENAGNHFFRQNMNFPQ